MGRHLCDCRDAARLDVGNGGGGRAGRLRGQEACCACMCASVSGPVVSIRTRSQWRCLLACSCVDARVLWLFLGCSGALLWNGADPWCGWVDAVLWGCLR